MKYHTKPDQPELEWPEIELSEDDRLNERLAFLLTEVERSHPSQPDTQRPPWE